MRQAFTLLDSGIMTTKNDSKNDSSGGLSGVSRAFLEHNIFLKKFIAGFLQREQDIEDVVQEAYLKAFSVEQDRGEITQPKAFLFTIAKNIALNELNRKSRQMTDYIEDCQVSFSAESTTTTENEIEAQQALSIYCEAIVALPEKCRHVYLLRKVHGLPHKEIAQRLSISLSSVEKHLRVGSISCRNYIRTRTNEYSPDKLPVASADIVAMEGVE